MEKISQLEDTLVIAVENTDKAAVYRNYLELEINDIKDPSRIQALYERIVAELPLFDTFWFEYCRFVDRQLKNVDATMTIFNRAIRNCPWNSSIWSDYIYACERYEKEHGFISGKIVKPIVSFIFNYNLIIHTVFNRSSRKSFQYWTCLSGRLQSSLVSVHRIPGSQLQMGRSGTSTTSARSFHSSQRAHYSKYVTFSKLCSIRL